MSLTVERAAHPEGRRRDLVTRFVDLVKAWEARQRTLAVAAAMEEAVQRLRDDEFFVKGVALKGYYMGRDRSKGEPPIVELIFRRQRDPSSVAPIYVLSVLAGNMESRGLRRAIRIEYVADGKNPTSRLTISKGVESSDGRFEADNDRWDSVEALRGASQATDVFLERLRHSQRANYNRRG